MVDVSLAIKKSTCRFSGLFSTLSVFNENLIWQPWPSVLRNCCFDDV